MRHLLSKIGFGVGLQFLQDHRGDLLRAVPPIPHLYFIFAVLGVPKLVRDHSLVALNGWVIELAAHETLDRKDRVLRIRDRLPAREAAHQPFAAGGDRDDRWGQSLTLRIRDDRRLATL